MAMSACFLDLLFAFRRRIRRAPGRQPSRNNRVGAVAALAAALVLFCPGLALAAPGDLDPTFGTGGKVTTDFAGEFAGAEGVAVQADSKIIAVGASNTTGIDIDFALARYNTDGSLDSTFGTGGKVTTDFGGSQYAVAVAVQADGKIIAAGDTYVVSDDSHDFALARYNTDGSLDTSFGTGGKVTTDFGDSGASGVALQADGKIIAAGYSVGINYDFALARYNTDGSLDSTFGTGGKVTTDFGGAYDEAFAVALQADGKIIAVGASGTGGEERDFALARYNTDGSLDSTFGTGGKVTTTFGDFDGAQGVAVQADGKIVAAGDANNLRNFFALARYNTDGSLDSTFGTGGKVTTDFGGAGDSGASAVAVQADGKIVAAGSSVSIGGTDFALARYQDGGSIPQQPSLTIGKSHTGDFTQGRQGNYTILVGNDGPGATDGSTVTVHDTLPEGLTAADLSGSGWDCTPSTLTCTRSDALPAGSNYPPITLKADVSCKAPPQGTDTATVTGGGDTATHTATDPTTIKPNKRCQNHHRPHHRPHHL
ncbi:calcium-binding protein [Streptomyces sp. NPDC086549]|uniref:calcium-binding protein n=1 Tax=Streptomyces sp. NPDC086549 TaxID=3365752 RepID=UPI0038189412